MRCLKLPWFFDPAGLRADLARVPPDAWIPHINRHDYEGQWSGVALRSVEGTAHDLAPEARGGAVFRDTVLLGLCPHFQEVLATLRCPLQSARLLRLHAGSFIAEHVDQALDFDDGEVRLHVPIVTSDDVLFFLDGARLVMVPGECWYTNVNLPHSVENRGSADRIHLVIDCLVNDWMRELFAATAPEQDHQHRASRQLVAGSSAADLFAVVSEFAACASTRGAPVAFRAGGPTLTLAWPGDHAWQIRLRLAGSGHLELESSPDPAGARQADFAALLERLRRFATVDV